MTLGSVRTQRTAGCEDRCFCWLQLLEEEQQTLRRLHGFRPHGLTHPTSPDPDRSNAGVGAEPSWWASAAAGAGRWFCCSARCGSWLTPPLLDQNEEGEAREEEEERREGSCTVSTMESAATPSFCPSWKAARREDPHHSLSCMGALAAASRETRPPSTGSGPLGNSSTWKARWRTTRSGCRR